METKHCGEVANKISLFKRLIREKGKKSGRREKQPKKLGRREKNRGKNREKRNLTVRSSPLCCGTFLQQRPGNSSPMEPLATVQG